MTDTTGSGETSRAGYDNSDLNRALLLGAVLIDFQGKKIDVQSKQLELLGLEKDELRAQIARVKDRRTAQVSRGHARK